MPVILVVGDGDGGRAIAAALSREAGVQVRSASRSPGGGVPAFIEGRTFDLLLDADLVVEASGDRETRYLANDAAAVRGIPLVWVDEEAGEVGTAFDEIGVDYRDLHSPDDVIPARPAPPAILVAEAVAQATTALVDVADAGLVMTWDGTALRQRRFTRSGAARPGSLEERTEIPEPDDSHSVTAPQLAKLLAGATTLGVHEPVPVLLDVREDPEVSFVTLPGAVHIPIGKLPERLDELADEVGREAPIVVYCHHGVRSSRAMGLLQRAGFRRVRHLTGGIDAYAAQVDPTLPRY